MAVASSENPSNYGDALTFTATINAANGLVRHRNGVRPRDVTGTVAWSSNTNCGTTAVSYMPGTGVGTATCTLTEYAVLPAGSDTITATYSGDSNHSSGVGTLSQVVNQISPTFSITTDAIVNTNVVNANPSTYGEGTSSFQRLPAQEEEKVQGAQQAPCSTASMATPSVLQ